MCSRLIVALDFHNQNEALKLIDSIDPSSCALKVGSELFTLLGPQWVSQLVKRKFNVFLDLKFHDIPNTVANACKAAADLGVWMMNVHASGGLKMMHAAKNALNSYGTDSPLLIAVTVLTSMSADELDSISIDLSLLDQVKKLALLAKEAGLDGVVCSAHEVNPIKTLCGTRFITVTPGIRLSNYSKAIQEPLLSSESTFSSRQKQSQYERGVLQDDQSRIMSPEQAIKEGSDYLVVGRPITQSANPQAVITEILKTIEALK